MEETKKWYTSRSVWGGIIVIGATVAGGCGYVVDEATQGQVLDYIMTGVTALGGLMAIVGRMKADKAIE